MSARTFTHDEHRRIRELLSCGESDKHLEHKIKHLESEITRIVVLGSKLERDLEMSNAKLDALQSEVAAERDVIAAAKKLIAGLDGQIAAAVTAARMGDDAQVDAIRADVKAQADDLAASVAAGTKADPSPSVAASAPPTVAPAPAPVVTDPPSSTIASAAGASTGGSTV